MALRIKSMLRWLVYRSMQPFLRANHRLRHLFIHTSKTSRVYQKHIQRRNQPKTHKIRFDTTTQYHQENKTVFTSIKLT